MRPYPHPLTTYPCSPFPLQVELELQAALDKLEVYRRTQAPGVSDIMIGGSSRGEEKGGRGVWGPCVAGDRGGQIITVRQCSPPLPLSDMPLRPSPLFHPKPSVSIFADRRPDADKNEEELRVELGQLRDVWRMDQDELKKLHAVREEGYRMGRRTHISGSVLTPKPAPPPPPTIRAGA